MTQLVAAYLRWGDEALPAPLAERLARSLAVGTAGSGAGSVRRVGSAALVAAPASRGWSPARTGAGDHVLFAGHLDNRAALRADLGVAAGDDARLYAAARDAWGEAADRRVIGAYAAILYHPDRPELHVVRSPLIGPPLHLWHDGERAIAASNPGAIFATGEVPREVDETKLADSLYLNYAEYARSWFRGVRRLPAGCRAVLSQHGVTVTRYHDPGDLPKVRLGSDAEYAEAAAALFAEATSAALDGAARPAVSLSGGLDSQAVAAEVLRQRPGRPLDGFCAVPEAAWDGAVSGPRGFGDEWPHVEALAGMYPDLRAHRVPADGLSFDHRLEAMFLLTGVPPRNAMTQFWLHGVRETARAQGCDRMLTGAWGNITFSFDGAGALPGWLARGQWGRLTRELWRGGSRRHAPRRLWRQAVMPHLPAALPAVLWHRGEAEPSESWCPLDPGYMRRMQVAERTAGSGFDPSFRPRASSRAMRLAMLGNAAQEGADLQQGMDILHGIETRDPTAYRPLLEFCFGLPDDQYLRDGRSRWLARRMLRGRIPGAVLQEQRRGVQSADWHLRLGRQRTALMAELDALAQDPEMAARLDLPGLRHALETWPDSPPTDPRIAARLRLAVPRALVTARFVRHVTGRNEGRGDARTDPAG